MQISPNQLIQLAANLGDTSDGGTYYVRAVMRDTASNKVLGSVNLTMSPSSNRRFYGSIAAPSAAGPAGRYIDITTTIYLDALHTTPAPNYYEVIEKYLVAPLWNAQQGGGGSGDPFAGSYERDGVRKTIREEFAVIVEEIGKIGTPTVVVEGKVVENPDAKDLPRKLEEAVIRAMASGKKDKKKEPNQITAMKREVLAGFEDLMDKLDGLDSLQGKLGEFDGMVESIDELRNRLEYIWEHIYMREMTGDGSPLPPERLKNARTASSGVIPMDEVMKRHTERRAGFFDAPVVPTPDHAGMLPDDGILSGRKPTPGVVPSHLIAPTSALPAPDAAPEQPPTIPTDFNFTPSKRKPTEGVVPSHVVANNRRALDLMPTPA